MSVLSQPSPTLSPRSSFSHDRAIAGLRRSSSSLYRLSTSSSQQTFASSHVSSPSSAPTPTSAPKRKPAEDDLRQYISVDAGTQYTPPDYPPTARRPMNAAPLGGEADAESTPREIPSMPAVDDEGDVVIKDALQETAASNPTPPEPSLRQDPQPHTPTGSTKDSMPGSSSSSVASVDDASPTKRARGETTAQVMPREYMRCNVKDLGNVIADMLLELIRINDPLPFKNEQLTRYHSRAPPGISVHDYLSRLIVHATLSPPILLSLVYYIDKLSALYPVFNISSLTVHRYLITAATVAAKGLSDSFWTNNTYARVGGISVRELALLELDFLERMDWKIVPPADILNDYYRNLVERNDKYVLEEVSDRSESSSLSEAAQTNR